MRKRKVIIVISVITIIAALVVAYLIWKNKKESKIEWITVQPTKGSIQILVTATGTVNAMQTVLIGTQVSGVISKIYVDYNSIVRKGQVLAELDTRSLRVSLEEAEANLSKSKAQLDQIKVQYERDSALFSKGLIAKSDLDVQYASYISAKKTVEASQGEINKAKINIDLAVIRSPIDGIIVSRGVELGQTVAASFSTPTLFTVANDLKKMQLQANVDEADIGQINLGQSVFFSVDAYPDTKFTGVVQQIRLQPIATNNVVSYAVMIDAPNDELKLVPGMNANISIVVQESKDVIRVPLQALYFTPGKNQKMIDSTAVLRQRDSLSALGQALVFTLNDGNLTPVIIQTGLADGVRIEVKEGGIDQQTQLVTGVKVNGEVAPQSKGLIQTPQRRQPRR